MSGCLDSPTPLTYTTNGNLLQHQIYLRFRGGRLGPVLGTRLHRFGTDIGRPFKRWQSTDTLRKRLEGA